MDTPKNMQRNLYVSFEAFKESPYKGDVVVLKDGRELFFQEIGEPYKARVESYQTTSTRGDIHQVAVINESDIVGYKKPNYPSIDNKFVQPTASIFKELTRDYELSTSIKTAMENTSPSNIAVSSIMSNIKKIRAGSSSVDNKHKYY